MALEESNARGRSTLRTPFNDQKWRKLGKNEKSFELWLQVECADDIWTIKFVEICCSRNGDRKKCMQNRCWRCWSMNRKTDVWGCVRKFLIVFTTFRIFYKTLSSEMNYGFLNMTRIRSARAPNSTTLPPHLAPKRLGWTSRKWNPF